MAWGKAGSSTTPTTSNVSVTGISANDILQSLLHITTSGQYSVYNTFNDVSSGTLYHGRYETNGTTDQTYNQDRLFPMLDNSGGSSLPTGGDIFNMCNIVNLETEEKLVIGFSIMANGTGAGNAPKRNQYVAKFANTSDKITSIENFDPSLTAYTSDSNASALGSEITPASAIPFPENVELGSRAEITDTRKIYYRMDSDYETDKWFELGTVPYAGGRGVFAGGYSGSNINVIDYITIATTGNATDFGDMTVSRRNSGVCSNKTRGLMCGGYTSSDQPSNIIDYITIATPSNSTDFGDMDNTVTNGIMGIGSETRALFGGGESGMTNRIAYLTISTPSNSTDFGDLTVARKGGSSTGDGTKGIWMGGEEGGQHGVTIDYVTISTTGNASDWGDLSSGTASGSIGLVSNGTIGLLVTGGSYSNRVDKKTIATNANSVDYGDLTDGRSQAGQCSTETRAVFAGGKYQNGGGSSRNIIDYMAIASGGNATDFGDLTAARYIMGGMSDTGAVRP